MWEDMSMWDMWWEMCTSEHHPSLYAKEKHVRHGEGKEWAWVRLRSRFCVVCRALAMWGSAGRRAVVTLSRRVTGRGCACILYSCYSIDAYVANTSTNTLGTTGAENSNYCYRTHTGHPYIISAYAYPYAYSLLHYCWYVARRQESVEAGSTLTFPYLTSLDNQLNFIFCSPCIPVSDHF